MHGSDVGLVEMLQQLHLVHAPFDYSDEAIAVVYAFVNNCVTTLANHCIQLILLQATTDHWDPSICIMNSERYAVLLQEQSVLSNVNITETMECSIQQRTLPYIIG
eukprot:GHRR01033729.1.p1 GENE.GHRR01033729.1~~GHRR01033729.1.p1  ORF type:complete len:106 (-),score=26.51 GHRR01033729.1:449-766(-)